LFVLKTTKIRDRGTWLLPGPREYFSWLYVLRRANTLGRCYIGLGIDPTASDANVIFAYRKQVETDASRTAFYLTWLNQISVVRQSEEIQLEIVLQQSKGRFMLEQIHDAYKYFGFPTQDADDAHIIGTYKARLSDAPRQGSEMREHLRIIGEYRRNARIIEIAKGSKLNRDLGA
jgi:hypothetical protein